MKRFILAVAAIAAVCAYGAPDDSAVANRKWVRQYVSSVVPMKGPSVGGTTNTSWRTSFSVDETNTLTATIYTPTNPALFVAWSTVPEIPAYTFYAKVPGMQMYANATNAFLPTITYTVTNWTETTTNAAGANVSANFTSTRWRATDSGGGKWATGYLNGDTILCCATNTAKYIVIRTSTVTDNAARTLRGSYELQVVRDFRLLSLFAFTAYAEVETERGGGTLGYHQGLAMDVSFTSSLGGTYTVADAKDHQYNPYGGVDHADLKESDTGYLSYEMFSDPENWGYSFPLEVKYTDSFGNTRTSVIRTKKSFQSSPEWQEFVSNLKLPEPPQNEETPTITDDPGVHECGVADAEGNHIGCVCDYPFCKYCPNCKLEYKVTWSDGSQTTKTLSFAGARHNLRQVICDANGVVSPTEAGGGGCVICWAADNAENGTHFCGNETGTRGWGDENSFTHIVNDPADTGRENCGCKCAHYNDNSDVIPTTMHVHPNSWDDGHGEHCGQNSYCWCFCKREHTGVMAGNDAENTCPGHCLTCGAFHTVDGVELNGIHPTPMPYRVTDGEGDEISLEDHMPSESRCGCKCGAISPDSEATRDLLWDADSFHKYEEDGNGNHTSCSCKCGMKHQTVNNTGHCPKVCTLCGRVDEEKTIGGETINVPRAATWEDHTPDGEHCGCQCYQHQDGFHGEEEGVCGYDGTEKGPNESQMWHKRKTGADGTYCCCECGVYSDHRARDGSHMNWFVPGLCENFCGGINAFGQVCGKLKDEDRDTKEADHTPSDTACGCKCGTVTSETDTEAFHVARDATYSCMCQCHKFHSGEWVNKSCGTKSWKVCSENENHIDGTEAHEYANGYPDDSVHFCKCSKKLTEAHTKVAGTVRYEPGWIITPYTCFCGWSGETRAACTHTWGNWVKISDFPGGTLFRKTCTVCGAWDDMLVNYADAQNCNTNLNLHIPLDDSCGCKCGHYGTRVAEEKDFHKWDATDTEGGIANCHCMCGAKHEWRDGCDCPKVCAFCKEVKKDGTRAAEVDHTITTANRCGCKCGYYGVSAAHAANKGHFAETHVLHKRATTAANGTENSPAYCQCYGAEGTGGSWHWHDPRTSATCPNVCKWIIHGETFGHLAAPEQSGGVPTKLFQRATPANHVPNAYGCGCKCGLCVATGNGANIGEAYGSEDDKDLHRPPQAGNRCDCSCGKYKAVAKGAGTIGGHAFPITHSAATPICTCTCGKTHQAISGHVNACGYCDYCGFIWRNGAKLDASIRSNHLWTNGGCYCDGGCVVGGNKMLHEDGHVYADDSCTCNCGEDTVDHIATSTSVNVSHTTCTRCGAVFDCNRITVTCARCGVALGDSEYVYVGKHEDGCGKPNSPKPGCSKCGCHCTGKCSGHYCSACCVSKPIKRPKRPTPNDPEIPDPCNHNGTGRREVTASDSWTCDICGHTLSSTTRSYYCLRCGAFVSSTTSSSGTHGTHPGGGGEEPDDPTEPPEGCPHCGATDGNHSHDCPNYTPTGSGGSGGSGDIKDI